MGIRIRKKAIKKDFFVEVKKTRNRYISLMLIVALGVAFYSGIRASDPDMRLSADKYYDEGNLMDIRVLGTLGLTEDDAEAIRQVEGVKDVMPAYSADVLCDLEEKQIVLKMMSIPHTVNKIDITEGRMPEAEDECLVDQYFLESTEYEIGDTIQVHAGGDNELEDTLEGDHFKIVGAGSTSYYMSLERGSSSIGNGTVHSFVIIPEEAFTLEVYTEIYITVEGARELTSYTDEYDELVSGIVDRIEEIEDARCEVRYTDIREDALKEIADAEKEIEDGEKALAEAEEELEKGRKDIEDGKKELEDGKKEIEEKEQELIDGEAELAANDKKLTDGEKELDQNQLLFNDGERQLAAGWQTLNEKKAELESGRAALEEGKKQIEAGETALAAAKLELEAGEAELNTGLEQIEGLRQTLALLYQMLEAGDPTAEAQIAELEAGIAQAAIQTEAAAAQLEQGKVELAAQEIVLAESRKQIEENEAQITSGEEQIRQSEQLLASQQAELESNRSQLAEARRTLQSGRSELEAGRKTLQEGREQLEEGKKELEEGEKELEEGEEELQEGIEEFEKEKTENEPKLEDARLEITDAKEELDALEFPQWFVLDRQYLQTYVEYGQNADRIGAIGKVFPAIFFLVAALVCLTTMTRMVEEQRTQIGTLKALGYRKYSIAGKYIIYALSASLIGSLAGLYIGQKLLPVVVIEAYKILYADLPEVLTPLNFWYSVSATLIAVFCTTLAAVFACYKEMASVPAKLMRPAAPKSGKRVFLEKIGFLWKRLNFSNKATIRNLIRYKKRFFMTVFGIGGCMALLLVGFGLKDSISSIGHLQFSNVRIYNSSIQLQEDITDSEREEVYRYVDEDSQVVKSMPVEEMTVDVGVGSVEKNAYLMVPKYPENLEDYVSLQGRISIEHYELSDEGVIISEKLSSLLDVAAGDTIYIKDGDTKKLEVTIEHITENYFFHYIYITPVLYKEIYGEEPAYNEIFTVNTEDDEAFEEAFAKRYMDMEMIAGVEFVSGTAERIDDMLRSMDVVIYVLVLSAGMLAFIVLYNLNNINVSERMRELATLKVLGFFDQEVSQYILRENIWLTVIGAIAGVIMGKILHYYVILTAEVDMTMFGRNIGLLSYVYSIAFTFAFSAVVNLVMHFKLKKINMVESMKSVE